jgi:hypothetical protein
MPNVIKYTTGSTSTGCLRKGNMLIGNNTADYGITFYNGIDSPSGGYTIYLNKASGGPSIYCPANDSQLIGITNQIAGANYTSAAQCLTYFASQTDKIVVNSNYASIVTSGLIFAGDSSFLPSYPATGTTWYDVSGNNNNGTLINGPTFNTGAKYIQFDGIDDYAQIINSVDNGSLQFTYYWTGNGQSQIAKGSSGGPMLYNGGNGITLHWYPANGGYDFYGILPNRAGWYNITVTWTGTSDNKMYMNGALVASSTSYSITKDSMWNFAANGYTPQAIRLQSIQVYNRALTQTEVLQNHHKGNITTDQLLLAIDPGNIVSYESGSTNIYNLYGTSSSTFQGTLSVNLNGSLINGPTFNSNNGGIWVFDGVDDYANLGNISYNRTNFSVFIWYNFPSYHSGWKDGTISKWYTGGGDGSGNEWAVGPQSINGPCPFGATVQYGSGGSSYIAINDTVNYVNNTWYHVGFTWNSGTLTLYVNGVQKVSATTANTTAQTTTQPVALASFYNFSQYMSNIYIGPAQIYNKTLSGNEVIQNFNAHRNRYGL